MSSFFREGVLLVPIVNTAGSDAEANSEFVVVVPKGKHMVLSSFKSGKGKEIRGLERIISWPLKVVKKLLWVVENR